MIGANFNGMRCNATRSMNRLKNVLAEVVALDSYDSVDESLKKRIKSAFDEAAQNVDVMNCLFDDEVVGDMDDLSDKLNVNRFYEDED